MKLTITKFLLAGLGLALLPSCGSFSTDQLFSVHMYGVSKAPATATGTRDPKFQNYQLLKVLLQSTDGATRTTLFDNEEEKILRIVDREQLIYSKSIKDLVGNAYGIIEVTFAPEVTGGEESGQELSFTLANPTLSLSQDFTVQKAKSMTLMIKMQWGNTMADGAMSEPAFELSLD